MRRPGIAAVLWEQARADALADGNRSGFTVRSNESAVLVHLRFGFQIAGPRAEKDGIAWVPIRRDR